MRKDEKMLFSFTIVPLGLGSDVAQPVARAIEVIADSGLDYHAGRAGRLRSSVDEVSQALHEAVRSTP